MPQIIVNHKMSVRVAPQIRDIRRAHTVQVTFSTLISFCPVVYDIGPYTVRVGSLFPDKNRYIYTVWPYINNLFIKYISK